MKDTDFEEGSVLEQEASTEEITVLAEDSEALEAVNIALDKMESEDVVDMVEEEVVEEPLPKRSKAPMPKTTV